MEFTLPKTGQKVSVRDFMPHGVVAKVNDAMFHGVKIATSMSNPTKDDLLREFGEDAIRELDGLPPKEYEQKLGVLRETFVKRKLEMDGLNLGNVEEANMRKIEGMALKEGSPVTRDWINELPQTDFEFLLEKIEAVGTDKKK